jgi:hypothetical protein
MTTRHIGEARADTHAVALRPHGPADKSSKHPSTVAAQFGLAQTTSDFVGLKKCDQGHASKHHIAKHDLRVGIAEIDGPLGDQGARSKMRNKRALWFAPEDALQ